MSVPNLFWIVEQEYAAFGPLDSHERCGEFTGVVAAALYAVDQNFGHLKKDPGRTNYHGRAVDAVLHKASGRAVDIITGSKVASPSNPGRPAWGVEEIARYSAADWIAPVSAPVPTPVPVPPAPVPAPVCQCKAGDVVEAIAALRLEMIEKHEVLHMALARIEDGQRVPRLFVGSARFVGTIQGYTAGIGGEMPKKVDG